MSRQHRAIAGAWLIAACAAGRAHGQSAQVIQIPAEVKAGTTMYAFTDGARPTAAVKTAGDFRFEVPPTARLMLYVPGYAISVYDFTGRSQNVGQPFAPQLVPLAPARVAARLVDSAGQPLAGRRLSLAYQFSPAFRFFGILDGNLPVISLGAATTASDGTIAVDAPSLAGDPALQRYGEGHVCVWDSDARGSGCGFDLTLRPNTFAPGTLDSRQITIVRTEPGTLAGRLGSAYLDEHRASGEARQHARVLAEATGPTVAAVNMLALYANVAADGSFSIDLPKGTYTVTFVTLKPNSPMLRVEQRDLLESGVAIDERRVHRIDRP